MIRTPRHRSSALSSKAVLEVCLAGLLASCGAATAPREKPRSAPADLHHGPLASYLPSPGLRWAVQLRPSEFFSHPELESAVGALFPAKRLEAYVALTSADPRRIREAWFAQYQLGSLWVFDAHQVGDAVEHSLRKRAWTASEPKAGVPGLAHWTYVADRQPSAFLRVEDHLAAVAEGDPSLVAIVRAYAEKKLKRSPPALASVHLAPLADFDGSAPVRLFALGPFEHQALAENADDLVASTLAVSAAAEAQGDELAVRLRTVGAWEQTGPGLAALWRARISALLQTSEVRALGGSELTSELRVDCAQLQSADPRTLGLELCLAEARFSLGRVVDRLHWLTATTLGAIANEATPASTGTPARAAPSGSD